MRISSSKAKGRRLQNYVVEKLLFLYSCLEDDDIKSAIMGESGEDIKLSPAARKQIRYSFECKNQERLSIWSALKQAEDNCNDRDPILIFKRNRSKVYAVLEFESLIDLIGDIDEKKQ